MELIPFLKPDLKKLIFFLIILTPLIIYHLPLPTQFYVWNTFFYSLTFIVMIPFIIASIFLFGDFDTGGGLFPSSDIVIYLIGSVFWFVISCEIANQWDRLFFG